MQVNIVTSGSIATDHLMRYPARFVDSFVADQLHSISTSFLADDLQVRRGGVAANISYGLSQLNVPSVLLGAVGVDFGEYRDEYVADAPHVNLDHVLVADDVHGARFSCTTDNDQNQIATFYPGAMSRASEQSIKTVHAEKAVDLVVISPNDPTAMRQHTAECRDLGIPFVADPSQQVAFMDGEMLRDLIDGAAYLFSNEYEASIIAERTGWSEDDIAERVTVRVITRGKSGSTWSSAGETIQVGTVALDDVVDPTGGGDAFRAGFFAAQTWGATPQQCCQVGSVLASFAIQAMGPQGYRVDGEAFAARLAETFGGDAADTARTQLGA